MASRINAFHLLKSIYANLTRFQLVWPTNLEGIGASSLKAKVAEIASATISSYF